MAGLRSNYRSADLSVGPMPVVFGDIPVAASAGANGRDRQILHTLSDPRMQQILLLINDVPRSAQEIAALHHVPPSSLYRKLQELRTLGLAAIQLSVLTTSGKRVHMYRSLVEEFRVELLQGAVRVHVRYRDLATERLRSMWESVREEARPR